MAVLCKPAGVGYRVKMTKVEMTRSLDDPRLRQSVAEPLGHGADTGEVSSTIELSMMVRVFHNLERAGAVPSGTTLSAELSDAQQRQMRALMDSNPRLRKLETPTSYEAALRVLVTDQDGNRKLDIDTEQLAASGLLDRAFEAAELEAILQRNPDAAIQHRELLGGEDTFYQRQIDAETFHSTDWGGRQNVTYELSDTAKAVQQGLRRTALEGPAARDLNDRLADVTSLLRRDPPDGVRRGLTLARGLLPDHLEQANRVITRLIRQTLEPSEARDALIQGLRDLPPTSFNLLVGRTESGSRYYRMLDADGRPMRGRPPDGDIMSECDGVNQSFDVSDFDTGYAEMADLLSRRSALIREMGLESEPALGDLRDYLADYARGRSMDEVADKLGELLSAFCVHCGDDTEYGRHAGDAPAIHDRVTQDVLGRNILDCEGFAYTARFLSDAVRDGGGQPRFATYIADTIRVVGPDTGSDFHTLLAVREHGTGDMFITSNADTTARRHGVSSTELEDLARATYFALDAQGYHGDAPLILRIAADDVFRDSATPYGPDSSVLAVSRDDRRTYRERP